MATRSERAEPRAERSEAGGGALGLSIYNKAPAGRFVFKSFYIAPVTTSRKTPAALARLIFSGTSHVTM